MQSAIHGFPLSQISRVYTGAAAPGWARAGSMWLDTVSGQLRKYDGAVWTLVGVEIGTVSPMALSGGIPSGYLECDGSDVSQATYVVLLGLLNVYFDRRGIFNHLADIFTTHYAHGLVDDDEIEFRAETSIPTGLLLGQRYYVVNQAGAAFQVSLTLGGAPVDFTSNGVGLQVVDHFGMFRLPDFRGRSVRGHGDASGADPPRSAIYAGTFGGEETHQLTVNELATHAHANTGSHAHANAGDHAHANTGDHQHATTGDHGHAATGDHGHNLWSETGIGGNTPVAFTDALGMNTSGLVQNAGSHAHANTGDHQHATTGDHGHAATGDHGHAATGDHGHAAMGANAAHENLPPFLTVRFAIYTGVH